MKKGDAANRNRTAARSGVTDARWYAALERLHGPRPRAKPINPPNRRARVAPDRRGRQEGAATAFPGPDLWLETDAVGTA